MKDKIIAIDFDRTISASPFPDVGKEVPGAFMWLRRFQEAGAKLILWTCRSDNDEDGPTLSDAVRFCRKQGVEFWGINQNPDWPQRTVCGAFRPKLYCHLFIDDRNLGCPKINIGTEEKKRWVVDWNAVGPMVMELLSRSDYDG